MQVNTHKTVSQAEWFEAHRAFSEREAEFMALKDEIAKARLALPWVKLEKTYVFDTPEGKKTLADLFGGNSQLIIKHFMLEPGQINGCVGCSFECDHMAGPLLHIPHHDVSFSAVARAPLDEIEAYKTRMGWTFPWVSSHGSDFNYDFGVSFTPEQMKKGTCFYNYQDIAAPIEDLSGLSAFYKDGDGTLYHTYSAFGRGAEEILSAYMILDMTPKGRNETGRGDLTDWVRPHDRYDEGGGVDETGRYAAGQKDACCG